MSRRKEGPAAQPNQPSLLPTQASKARQGLDGATVLLYGPQGIGKTTLASTFPAPLFLSTEPGTEYLDGIWSVPCGTWPKLLQVLGEVKRSDHQYSTLVVDTLDNAYRSCSRWVCAKNNVSHPGDLEFGKGYGLVADEWHRVLMAMALLPLTVVWISHSKDVTEADAMASAKRSKKGQPKELPGIRMTLSGSARHIAYGTASVCLLYVMDDQGHRLLRTCSSPRWDAKSRMFLPDPLWLPEDPARGWEALDAGARGEELQPHPPEELDEDDRDLPPSEDGEDQPPDDPAAF